MIQILKKSPPALSIRAGHLAKHLIINEGLHAKQVDIIPGAAGGPKGLGLSGLDQAIFGEFLPQAPKRRTLIGSSIGSWRFASILAWGAKQGTERLAHLYTHMDFIKGMTPQQISVVCNEMLNELILNKEQQITQNLDYHLTIMAVKSRHIFNSDRALPLLTSIAGIIASNTIKRESSQFFMQRVVVQPEHEQQIQLHAEKDFVTHYQQLNTHNLNKWLMASGSIPGLMAGVADIPDAPPAYYRDGGLIDYHLDLPYPSQGIVLYPHFSDRITPGWFDKFVTWRKAKPENHARTLLISPSKAYLDALPLGRLPDRKDFKVGPDQTQRIKIWQQCVAESQRLGDEFLELQHKENFAEYLQPLY